MKNFLIKIWNVLEAMGEARAKNAIKRGGYYY